MIMYYNSIDFNIDIDIAYAPMITPSYFDLGGVFRTELVMVYPLMILFIYLIPLFYITSKMAEEKESKAREGMKMMGLTDSAYLLSWLIFYAGIILVMSIIFTMVTGFFLFTLSSKFLIFITTFMYGLSLFGIALIVVSVFPTAKTSATVITLV
jgi:ATP-binding cassette subfamily A (ABC1) protein 3